MTTKVAAQFDLLFKAQGTPELRNMQAQLQALGQATANAQQRVTQFSKGVNDNARAFSGLATSRIQNTAFQIQDFAVQVASGTSATRALSQQLPQLLSGFGLFGAVIGTASAVLLPFVSNMKLFQENLDRVIGYATAAAAVMGGKFLLGLTVATGGLKAAAVAAFGFVTSLGALKLALIGTGIGALVILLGEAIATLIRLQEATGSWGEVARTVFGAVRGLVVNVVEVFQNIGLAGDAAWAAFASAAASAIAKVIGGVAYLSDSVGSLFSNLGADTIASGFASLTEKLNNYSQGFANSAAANYKAAGDALGKLTSNLTANADAAKIADAFASRYKGTLSQTTEELKKGGGAAGGAASALDTYRKSLEGARTPLEQTAAKLKEAQEQLRLFGKFLTPEELELAKRQIDELNAKITELTFEEKWNRMADGIKNATAELGPLGEMINEVSTAMQDQFVNGLSDAFISFVEGTKSGKRAFKEFALSFLKEISKMIIKSAILYFFQKALGMITGGMGGGIGGGLGGIGASIYSGGGGGLPAIAPLSAGLHTRDGSPQPMVTSIQPIGRQFNAGSIIPATGGGAAKMRSEPQKVTINNYAGVEVKTRQMPDEMVIEIATKRAKAEMTSDLRRGGNPLANAMEGAYAVRRAGR